MSLQTVGVIVCLFLAQVAAGTGVHFAMERHPDSYFCGHLQCVADFTKSDQDVSTFVEMTIYDITRVNSELKLASVSAFDPDLYVDTTKSSAMSCTGIISRLQANLTLKLRHDIDCLYGVYKCQLDLVTESGHPEVLTEIVIPENNHNYSRVGETKTDKTLEEVSVISGKFTELKQEVSLISHKLNEQTKLSQDKFTELKHEVDSLLKLSQDKFTELKQDHDSLMKLSQDKFTELKQDHDSLMKLSQDTFTEMKQDHDSLLKLVNQSCQVSPLDQDACIKGQPHANGTKRITLWGNTTALCDTTTDGGGWIIIQRRTNGDVDFNRGWNEYKNGFGNMDTGFWLGNDALHRLTEQGYNELRIDMIYEEKRAYAHYSSFSVASEALNYRLTVGPFEGTATDSLTPHNNMYFTTFDRDNDNRGDNCAVVVKGAWWYNSCQHSNLNGLWGKQGDTGMLWYYLTGLNSVSFSEMKIRRG